LGVNVTFFSPDLIYIWNLRKDFLFLMPHILPDVIFVYSIQDIDSLE